MNILLCGLPKCGKTTIGTQLAGTLGWNFIDTDQLVSTLHNNNLSCREIFQQEGEVLFRKYEEQALRLIENSSRTVIALGGGTLCHPANPPLIRSLGTVIYLRCPTQILWNRIVNHGIPAYLDPHNPELSFYSIATARIPLYEDAADRTIDTENRTVGDVVNLFFKDGTLNGK